MTNLIEDELGSYRVLNSAGGKPTTIEYRVRCENGKTRNKIIGSPTTRRKTLDGKFLLCGECGLNMFRDNRLNVYKYMKRQEKKYKEREKNMTDIEKVEYRRFRKKWLDLPNTIDRDVVMSVEGEKENKVKKSKVKKMMEVWK